MHLFNVFNSYFDKIWVLSLETATERRAAIKQHLEGLNYTFFNAVDKATLSESDLIAENIYSKVLSQKHHRYGEAMNLGQIACALSHKKMYEIILQEGYQRTLILEDDVQPILENSNFIETLLSELPQHWELLYFDYSRNEHDKHLKRYWYHVQHAIGGLKWSHNMIHNLYAKPFSTYLKIAGYHDYTDAYVVTYNGAKKLLAMQNPVMFTADNLLANACSNKYINAYISVPKVFLQTSQGENASLTSSVR
jgi:glycosyl transferase, family 25